MLRLLLIVLLFVQGVYAQKEANIWYFGQNAGLNFNSGAPVALTDGMLVSDEPCSAVSDTDGNLLFYTNGVSVWNRNHQVMPNGSGLEGHVSSTQGATIVPKPGSLTEYYIFTVDGQAGFFGVRYSVVDMGLAGGFGDVTDEKNILVQSPSPEKLTVTTNADNTGYWIISHGYDNNTFFAHLLTEEGLSTNPVISNVGIVVSEGFNNNFGGAMKLSPDGTRLVAAHASLAGTLELFDFDTTTGVISDPQVLISFTGVTGACLYGVEFSPDSKKIYATSSVNLNHKIYQFDLTEEDLPASATVVFESGTDMPGALQLGPDKKIYIAFHGAGQLGAIHTPNISGTGCNVEAEAVDLAGKLSRSGLPNFVQSFFYHDVRLSAERICEGETARPQVITSEPLISAEWDMGDGTVINATNPEHTYTSPGEYSISAILTTAGGTTLLMGTIVVSPAPQAHTPQDIILCDDGAGTAVFHLRQQDGSILGTQDPGLFSVTYHISAADADEGANALPDNYANTNPQAIHARVTDNATGCHAIAQFGVEVLPELIIAMDDSYTFCRGSSITLTAPNGFDVYEWTGFNNSQSLEITQPGTYTLIVYKNTGSAVCSAAKAITVVETGPPVLSAVDVNDWSSGRNSIAVITEEQDIHEYSIDGINYQDSNTFSGLLPGFYTVYVRNSCGRAQKEVAVLDYPKFFTPNADGENDTWHITASYAEPAPVVYIYDRYGKLLSSFKGNGAGWDGRHNGHDLPSTDYWFVAIRPDGREYKGHFSMMR